MDQSRCLMEFYRGSEHCLHEDCNLWGDCLFRILHVLPPCSLTVCPCLLLKLMVERWSCLFFGGFGLFSRGFVVSFRESSFKKRLCFTSTDPLLSSNQIRNLEVLKQQEKRHQQLREELGEVVPRSHGTEDLKKKSTNFLGNLRLPHPMPF